MIWKSFLLSKITVTCFEILQFALNLINQSFVLFTEDKKFQNLSQHVNRKEMATISIPSFAIKKFIKEARENHFSNDIVETLCYFLASKSEEEYLVDTVIFPKQTATQSRVDDEGKIFANSMFISYTKSIKKESKRFRIVPLSQCYDSKVYDFIIDVELKDFFLRRCISIP